MFDMRYDKQYQREIMDAITNPNIHKIAIITSARVGKTSMMEKISNLAKLAEKEEKDEDNTSTG